MLIILLVHPVLPKSLPTGSAQSISRTSGQWPSYNTREKKTRSGEALNAPNKSEKSSTTRFVTCAIDVSFLAVTFSSCVRSFLLFSHQFSTLDCGLVSSLTASSLLAKSIFVPVSFALRYLMLASFLVLVLAGWRYKRAFALYLCKRGCAMQSKVTY